MSDLPSAPRRYSDKEVRRILERATELQESGSGTPGSGGLSLTELQSIAREAGIDVEAVRRAAAEVESGARPEGVGAKLAGAPVRVVLEQLVPGERTPETFADTVPLIQTAAGMPGDANLVGNILTWRAESGGDDALRRFQVTLSNRGGNTVIRIEESYGGLAGVVFGTAIGGLGGGVGFGVGMGVGAALGSALMMALFPAAALGITFAGSRVLYSWIVKRRRVVLDQLMADLVAELEARGTKALPEGDV